MNSLAATVAENIVFVLEFIGLVILMVAVAYLVEKWQKTKKGTKERSLNTRKIAVIDVYKRQLCDRQ